MITFVAALFDNTRSRKCEDKKGFGLEDIKTLYTHQGKKVCMQEIFYFFLTLIYQL